MKYLLPLLFCLIAGSLFSQEALITEFHYDDSYSSPQDSFEFVEVYLPDPQPTNLNEYKITLYQGSSVPPIAEIGDVHRFKSLAEYCMFGDTPTGAYYVVEFPDTTYLGFTFGGIENGPDGIAFSGPGGAVYKFLSYSGTFTATEGPANGMTSTQITNGNGTSGSPVQENNSTPTTNSLQQNGFDAWTYNVPFSLALENASHSGTGFSGNVPVELLSFEAVNRDGNVHISWSTATEIDNDRYELLFSEDGEDYRVLKIMKGAGNSTSFRSYNHVHRGLLDGVYYYKLNQVDLNGDSHVYDVKSVRIDSKSAIQLFPTNAQHELQLKNVEPGTEYKIFNIQGRLVRKASLSETSIDIAQLQQGSYVVHISGQQLFFNKL